MTKDSTACQPLLISANIFELSSSYLKEHPPLQTSRTFYQPRLHSKRVSRCELLLVLDVSGFMNLQKHSHGRKQQQNIGCWPHYQKDQIKALFLFAALRVCNKTDEKTDSKKEDRSRESTIQALMSKWSYINVNGVKSQSSCWYCL